jgi:hypothetical protein
LNPYARSAILVVQLSCNIRSSRETLI